MSSIEKAMGRQMTGADKSSEKTEKSTRKPGGDPQNIIDNGANKPVHKIDIARLEQQGMLITNSEGHRLAEEYRMIKRPLLRNAFSKGAAPIVHANLVIVMSALAGEGKSFTTLNLAISMAMERDTTVLVVDSDVIKHSLTDLLGLSGSAGLTDLLLSGDMAPGEVIVHTDIPKLKILPAGNANTHSTELLASERMFGLLNELSERYPDRIVLFDSPPLLSTTQASVLTYTMGQILVVVESGKTTQATVKEALSLIDSDKVIGMVLNKRPHYLFGGDYSDYPYGYGQPSRSSSRD